MPLPLLAAAIPAAVGVGAKYLQKPKKEDYEVDTTYLDKYISNLRGRQADRDVYHMAMQPALRQIGAQGRRMQRGIGYATEKAGLTGSGIEAQQRLSAGRTTMGAMQEASEQATSAQIVESRRLGEQAEKATMQKGAMVAQGEQAFKRAKNQWGREMTGAVISGVANVASAGLNTVMQQKQAFDAAKAAGDFEGTFGEFRTNLGTEGYGKWSTTGAAYGAQLGRETSERDAISFAKAHLGGEAVDLYLGHGGSAADLREMTTRLAGSENFDPRVLTDVLRKNLNEISQENEYKAYGMESSFGRDPKAEGNHLSDKQFSKKWMEIQYNLPNLLSGRDNNE